MTEQADVSDTKMEGRRGDPILVYWGQNRVRDIFRSADLHRAIHHDNSAHALGKSRIPVSTCFCNHTWEAYNYAGQNPVMRTHTLGLRKI